MIVVLTGANDLALHNELHKIIDGFKTDFGDSIENFDGMEITTSDSLLDSVRSISFLDPRKLVIVRSFSKNLELMGRIEDIIAQTADSTDLVFVEKALDKRTTQYKFLQKNTDMRVFNDLSPNDLARWITEYLKHQGSEITVPSANYLIEQIGPNQYRLKNELDKLLLTEKTINKELIDVMVEPVAQTKIFSLLDALFRGDGRKAWAIYKDQRAQGEEPQKIMGMITWQLQQLALAVFAPSKSQSVLVGAGMSPYSAQKSLQVARTISKSDMKYYINQFAEIDYKSKTSVNVESALEVYVADVASRQSRD